MRVFAAWHARAMYRRAIASAELRTAARLATIAHSSDVDMVAWAREQAANEDSAGRRALMLGKLAAALADGGRTSDALGLVREAIVYARLADRQTLLELVPDVAMVLASVKDTQALSAIARELLRLPQPDIG